MRESRRVFPPRRLSPRCNDAFVRSPQPAPAIALPKETYKNTMTIRLQGRSAELRYSKDVHTDGDTYVYFPDANVLVTGDIVFFGRYPNIDFAYGGSIDGMIRGVEELLNFAREDAKIVPVRARSAVERKLRARGLSLAEELEFRPPIGKYSLRQN
jgi:cyclase